jgi:VIT1/CCC1 family predicted Fe2+/Mn2+ transporter
MPVKIITDSVADIPSSVAAQFGITVVPLNVVFGGVTYRDGVDISTDQFYRRLADYLSRVDARENMTMRDTFIIIWGTFLRSAGAGLVVVIPFFLMDDVRAALWVSNLLGILLLFGVGYLRSMDRRPLPRLVMGFGTSLLGIIIAGITVILGG